MSMSRPAALKTPWNARTLKVELVVPCMRENVVHSAKYLDGTTEKERAFHSLPNRSNNGAREARSRPRGGRVLAGHAKPTQPSATSTPPVVL